MTAKKPPPRIDDWKVLDLVHQVDGDTVDLLVERSIGPVDTFDLVARGVIRCRLVHLDTPEHGEPGFDEATAELNGWLRCRYGILRVSTQGRDAFGRYLSDIYVDGSRYETASDFMVRDANYGDGWPVWVG